MENQFLRTEILLGADAMKKLKSSKVAIFGVGGVGGYVVEALARSGVGAIDLIDKDTVALSNINRQIIATMDTVGRDKVDVMAERIRSINPDAIVYRHKCFYLPETAEQFDFSLYDYVVDAIDTVTGKIQLILQAGEAGVPIISAMGAGNKLDPSRFEVADIYQTSVDPLARVMRRELKKRGVEKLKVVYSKEKPLQPAKDPTAGERGRESSTDISAGVPVSEDSTGISAGVSVNEGSGRRSTPGSLAFVPSVAGLIIAGEVVRDLCGIK